MERKRVVILGSGFAGAAVAAKLDKANGVDVTLVSPREGFMLHKIAGLRASVKEGNWPERTLIPTDKIVKIGETVVATATSVDPAAKIVKLSNGKELKYDVLVIATGSRNFSPGDAPTSATTREAVLKYYAESRAKLTKTKNVVILGSGAVALELASEIRESGQPDAKITLVSRAPRILTDGAKYRESGLAAVESDLKKLNINLILKDELSSHMLPDNVLEANPIVETPNGVTLKSGKKIACDLLVYAVGSKLNTSFLPSQWLDARTGEVIVDPQTLVLKSDPNVFALGDVAKVEGPKRAYFASEDGAVVAKNVLLTLKGKKPTNKIQRMNMIALNLGSNGGRLLLPFTTLGPWMTTKAKSKSLFVEQFWGKIAPGAKVPKAS